MSEDKHDLVSNVVERIKEGEDEEVEVEIENESDASIDANNARNDHREEGDDDGDDQVDDEERDDDVNYSQDRDKNLDGQVLNENENSYERTEYSNLNEAKSFKSRAKTCVTNNHLELFKKLEIVKEIKTKTIHLQNLKSKLMQEVDQVESETKCVKNFQIELDMLIQEKLAHLEELRQIQNDIMIVEKTIKQSEEDKKRAIESAKQLHDEYKPLKEHLNSLRESIGLEESCNDTNNDETILIESFLSKLTPNLNENKLKTMQPNEKPKQASHKNNSSFNDAKTGVSNQLLSAFTSKQQDAFNANNQNSLNFANFNQHHRSLIENLARTHQHQQHSQQIDLPSQLATVALMAHSLNSQTNPNCFSSHQQQEQLKHHFNPFMLSQKIEPMSNQLQPPPPLPLPPQQPQQIASSSSLTPSSIDQMSSFRQQPPPMKTCLSCNQQIHRNAPICPLCKAKSRSRNPKKPKKNKNEDGVFLSSASSNLIDTNSKTKTTNKTHDVKKR